MFRSDRFRPIRNGETATLLPPKLDEFGHRPFAARERESLALWLQEPAWPRGTMNIYALEGYLIALLVWPVAVQPGAWLPPIWNETGWKLRPPIDTAERYEEFVELILGFLRTIDERLLQTPPLFEPSVRLQFAHDSLDVQGRAQHWARGFGRGLRQGLQTRMVPTASALEAVRSIATYTESPSRSTDDNSHHTDVSLTHAVLALANSRISRGPLGTLPKRAAIPQRADSPIQPPEDPMVKNE
jgi:yecA family protein